MGASQEADTGETGRKVPPPPPSAPPGQESQASSPQQGNGPGSRSENRQEDSGEITSEEAEKNLVRECLEEAIPLALKEREAERLSVRLGLECQQDLSEAGKREATEAWKNATAIHWEHRTNARAMAIRHMEVAQRLQIAYGLGPGQIVDIQQATRMEMARLERQGQETASDKRRKEENEEVKARRDQLAEEQEDLRKQVEEADRMETEAKAAVICKTNRYTQVVEAKLKEDEKLAKLLLDIARDEAAAKERDAATRRSYSQRASADE